MLMLYLRKNIMARLWDKERAELIFTISQLSKTKKNKVILEKLQELEEEVRDYALSKYLGKCYVLYNAAFFKWHNLATQQLDSLHKKTALMNSLTKMTRDEQDYIDLHLE